MARKKSPRRESKRGDPNPSSTTENLLSFLEAPAFTRVWRVCGLTDDNLFDLQRLILTYPKGHPVIAGTGGLRKIRFSPVKSPRGKSGSHRACYVYYEKFGLVLLLTAYPKNEKDDLSAVARKAIRNMIEEQNKLLDRGPIR
jgi:hypothetical protein